jgi:Na+-driven multidrug efflux pump
MYNMVDTIVVGRFVSIDALAAIGAASSTSMFIMLMGNGLTNGLSVIISQAEGAKQGERLLKAVTHAVYLVLGGSLVLGLAAFFGARPMMTLLGAPENIIDQSVVYIQITGGLTVALLSYNGITSVLRAIGDSRTPLYFLIFSSLLNVGLDLFFVLALHGGVAGVAWATVFSQLVSAVLCLVYMAKK